MKELIIKTFAAKPQPPENCTLRNSTGGGHLEVVCRGAHGGGLEQVFVIEVTYYRATIPLKAKITDLISIKSIICHSQHSGVRHKDPQEVAQRDQV